MLLLDADSGSPDEATARMQRSHPGLALIIHRVTWPTEGRSSPAARLGALARAYDYSELPLAIVVSKEGQVVRIQQIHPTR